MGDVFFFMNFKPFLLISVVLFFCTMAAISAVDLNETCDFETQTNIDDAMSVNLKSTDNNNQPINKPTITPKINEPKIAENNDTTIKGPKIGTITPPKIPDNNNMLDYIKNKELRTTIPILPEVKSFDELQNQINAAPEGSTIILDSDYKNYGKKHLYIAKDLTIDGQGHYLDGSNNGQSILFSAVATVTLKNLNLFNGHNYNNKDYDKKNGGGIHIQGIASFVIENCTFQDNSAEEYGGAIYNGGSGKLTIKNCEFLNNKADNKNGGAIYSIGNIIIEDSKFLDNTADNKGGAISNDGSGKLTIKNCEFINNKANDVNGGAIYSLGDIIIEDSKFINNTADEKGGAIFSKSTVQIKNTLLKYNGALNRKWEGLECLYKWLESSDRHGGALCSEGDVYIVNSIVEDNLALGCGGGIYSDKNIHIDNTTVNNNYAANKGGGVYGKENIYINQNPVYMKSTFINNKLTNKTDSNYWGGGLYCCKNAYINNTYFDNNCISLLGGAVFCEGETRIENSRFTRNSGSIGGAVYSNGNVYVLNSVFTGNYASNDIFNSAGAIMCENAITFTDSILLGNVDCKEKQICSKKGNVKIINNIKYDCEFDSVYNLDLNKDVVNLFIKNSMELKDLFMSIKDKNPNWKLLNITLAPNTMFNVDYSTFDDQKFNYKWASRLTFNLIINGNSGSVIKGNGENFIYICPTATLKLINVDLKNFKHCFMNYGQLDCINSYFSNNYYKLSRDSKDGMGGVLFNVNSARFKDCTFINNKNELITWDYTPEFGCTPKYSVELYSSVLYAYTNSMNVFDNCDFKDCGDKFLFADEFSTVILYQENDNINQFKNCYFAQTASLCTISNKNNMEICNFTCGDKYQLNDVLHIINSLTPDAECIVINLQPVSYEFSSADLGNLKSMNWRDEFYNPSVKGEIELFARNLTLNWNCRHHINNYALEIGAIPVIINGNGANIKITDNNDERDNVFAFIGKHGILSVNNVTFSNFNTVFHNYGNLILDNCIFKDNVYNNKY